MARSIIMLALLVTVLSVGDAVTVSIGSVVNQSIWDDYQTCYYPFSIAGNTAGKDIFYTPVAYNNNGVPCTLNYGDWDNVLAVWNGGNVSTITSSGIPAVWIKGASGYALLYPQNNTWMFAYNWAIITQDSRQSAITMDQWGLNSLPYFDYDLDNFAINPAGNALFYTYQYRVGQGYTVFVSIIAMNTTNAVQTEGFYYQGEAYNGGYPAGGLGSLGPGYIGDGQAGNGGVAAVFVTEDNSFMVVTQNNTVNMTGVLPINITTCFRILNNPSNPDREVLVLLQYTPESVVAVNETMDVIPLRQKIRNAPQLTSRMLKGIHIERELSYNAPTTITQLLRVDVTAKKIVQRVTVPDATDMTTGWQGYVAVGGPDAIGILTTASLEVVGSHPLVSIDNYGPYLPYSMSFGTGYPGDTAAGLYWLSSGSAGVGITSAKLKLN